MGFGRVLVFAGIFLAVVIIIGVGVYSAESSSCPVNQTIMKLSSATNAHGALWDNENYPISICYTDFFPEYTGNNPHTCDGNNNLVLRLNDIGNAHTSTYNLTYNRKVCYGDLDCKTTSQRCDTATGYKLLVSLSDTFNAHISNSNDYSILICCKQHGSSITACAPGTTLCIDNNCSANCTLTDDGFMGCIGQANGTCELGEGCACADCYGKQDHCVSMAICNETTQLCECRLGFVYDPISRICAESEIPPPTIHTICLEGETLCLNLSTGQSYCSTENCLAITCNNDFSCDENEGCLCADCHGEQDSCADGLICDFRTDRCIPDPNLPDLGPSIEIINPTDMQKFKVGESIRFKQISSDNKKDLTINWTFGDGNVTSFKNCLTTGNCNTTHKYSEPGSYVIKAMAIEQGGLGQDEDFVNILVYEQGINVFSIITSPAPDETIPNGQDVYFNASASYVANCSLTEGLCISSVAGLECYAVGQTTPFYCYNFNSSKIGRVYEMKFDWTFDKGLAMEINLSGIWSGNYTDVVEFNRSFYQEGVHTAELKVTYGYYII